MALSSLLNHAPHATLPPPSAQAAAWPLFNFFSRIRHAHLPTGTSRQTLSYYISHATWCVLPHAHAQTPFRSPFQSCSTDRRSACKYVVPPAVGGGSARAQLDCGDLRPALIWHVAGGAAAVQQYGICTCPILPAAHVMCAPPRRSGAAGPSGGLPSLGLVSLGQSALAIVWHSSGTERKQCPAQAAVHRVACRAACARSVEPGRAMVRRLRSFGASPPGPRPALRRLARALERLQVAAARVCRRARSIKRSRACGRPQSAAAAAGRLPPAARARAWRAPPPSPPPACPPLPCRQALPAMRGSLCPTAGRTQVRSG